MAPVVGRLAAMTASSPSPAWLQTLLRDPSPPPPRLFAWTPANLDGGGGGGGGGRDEGADDLDRRIFVVGVGNIGRLYAAHLARRDHPPPVTLVVHRRDLLAAWAAGDGIELVNPAGPAVHVPKHRFAVEWWSDQPPDRGPVRPVARPGRSLRNLIVATKAPAALPAVDRLRRYLDAASAVALAHNGMAGLWPPHGPAYVARRWPPAAAPAFLACVTSHGLFSDGPFRSVHAARADAVVGPVLLPPDPPSSVAYLTRQIATAPQLDARAVCSTDLWLLQLEKLVFNSSINPLTAVLRCRNGALFDHDSGGVVARVLDRLLAETSAVLQALVAHESVADILAASPAPDATSLQQLQARFAHARLREMLRAFAARVGDNISSMLQDVRAGRQTELGHFNGWLVDMAAFLDPRLDTSTHRALIRLVEDGAAVSREELGRRLLPPLP